MCSFKFTVCCGIFRIAEELTEHSSKVSNDSEVITERWPGLKEPESPSDTEHLQEEEREEKEGDEECKETQREGRVREKEERSLREDEEVSRGEEREMESRCDQACENGESEVKGEGREFKKREEVVVREKVEDDIKEREERGSAGVPGVERSVQVLDGHIALGNVQWKDCRATSAGRVQV